MSDNINELLQELKPRPEAVLRGGFYDYSGQEKYDSLVKQIKALVQDAIFARVDAEAQKIVMERQARTIAELQAEIARLTRADEIKPVEPVDIHPYME